MINMAHFSLSVFHNTKILARRDTILLRNIGERLFFVVVNASLFNHESTEPPPPPTSPI